MSERVRIFEMSPRDGLQNEKRHISTERKVELVDRLSVAGFDKIEVTSFVSVKWVPQLADAAEVMQAIERRPGVAYTALTPNLKGFEAALYAKADEVAVFAAASESFSHKNINCSIEESLNRFAPLFERSRNEDLPVRAYVSCVTDCPFDGAVSPIAVANVASRLAEMGAYEVSLGDTIGKGTPDTVGAMLDAVLERLPADRLAGHFHDTAGRALDNIELCLTRGLRTFDASAGGLGGCPYAPGARGNVASEAVVERVEGLGFETGIDRAALASASAFARSLRVVG